MKANLKQTALVLGAVAASAAVPAFAAEGDLDFSSMISSVNGSAVIAAFMAMGVVKLGELRPLGGQQGGRLLRSLSSCRRCLGCLRAPLFVQLPLSWPVCACHSRARTGNSNFFSRR
ncbi:hypothetical protein ABRB19_12090 [Pseudomonas aeruginosa]